ncbi:MAG TPA: CocE/NonD family hydrolase [Gaiellaceae bacterium]
MARIHRPRGITLVGLLVLVLVLGVVFRSTVAANARALGVLSTTLRVPVAGWLTGVVTDEPRVADTTVAGAPSVVVRPGGGDGPWPAVVFVNGVTRRGRHHPDVRRLAIGLARAGYVVLVPDLPGLARGEITTRTLAQLIAVARAAAARSDARGGRVAFMGVSVGGTLALLAAGDQGLARRTTVVAAVAPYADLAEVIRLATTGRYRTGRRLVRFRAKPFLRLVVARSLVGGLAPGADRDKLRASLLAVPDDAEDPLAGLLAWPREQLAPEARALVSLLMNRDPARFDRLYARLAPAERADIARLSPIRGARRVLARVELASAPKDKYFPLAESRALAARVPDARLTVTSTLHHAVPRASFHDLADLYRFYAFVVRTLRDARTLADPGRRR